MKNLESRVLELKRQLEILEESYAKECMQIINSSKADYYSEKVQRKVKQVADKFAKVMAPLKEEYDQLYVDLAKEQETERKRKYVTPAEYENMSRQADKQKKQEKK